MTITDMDDWRTRLQDTAREAADARADRDRLSAFNAELVAALDAVIARAEWNGRRQGWDLPCDMPAGTITTARALIAKARDGKG